jgi:hypothetical protein
VLSPFSRHVVGDHALGQAPEREAQAAIASAERLVDATARWIERRS